MEYWCAVVPHTNRFLQPVAATHGRLKKKGKKSWPADKVDVTSGQELGSSLACWL